MSDRAEKPAPLKEDSPSSAEPWLLSRDVWRWYFWAHVLVVAGSCMISQFDPGSTALNPLVVTLWFVLGAGAIIGTVLLVIGPLLALYWLWNGLCRGRFSLFLHAIVSMFLTFVQMTAMIPAVQ